MNNYVSKANRLPREVWAAAISIKGLWPVDTIEKRMKDLLARMENVYAFEPDVIVIPETIQTSWVKETKSLEEIAEDDVSDAVLREAPKGLAIALAVVDRAPFRHRSTSPGARCRCCVRETSIRPVRRY
mgnify:CR=1 FL=1